MAPHSDRGWHGGRAGFFEEITATLVEYADKVFELSVRHEGVTREASLRQIEKSTGVIHPDLILPDLSDVAQTVWNKYVSLHRHRRYGINGPERITYVDVEAWSRGSGWSLNLWETETIFRIDDEAVKSRS